MGSKNKTFDDIRRLSKSIEIKKNILIKYFKYFDKDAVDFIINSNKIREDFDNEIQNQDPDLDKYFNEFNNTNNILNSFVEYLKENNLYISENMKYKYKLREQEEPTQGGAEETPTGGGGAKEKIIYDLVLTPTAVSVDEVVKALNDVNNYGAYVSNLRNTKSDIEKAVIDHFGPNQRWDKLKKEKERGKPFPPKTKQAVDDFIRSLTSKPNLLKWEVKDEFIIFPASKNPTKKVTENIIDTIMDNAGIDYRLDEKEAINESDKIRNMVKEIFGQSNKLFSIDTDLAFKIYDILKSEYPEIGKNHTKTSFFHFLNDKLK